jgi:hypothetical protein
LCKNVTVTGSFVSASIHTLGDKVVRLDLTDSSNATLTMGTVDAASTPTPVDAALKAVNFNDT